MEDHFDVDVARGASERRSVKGFDEHHLRRPIHALVDDRRREVSDGDWRAVRLAAPLSGGRKSPCYERRMSHLGDLSNEELIASLRTRVRNVSVTEASIVVHLVEMA